jgi:hypothetical protein
MKPSTWSCFQSEMMASTELPVKKTQSPSPSTARERARFLLTKKLSLNRGSPPRLPQLLSDAPRTLRQNYTVDDQLPV